MSAVKQEPVLVASSTAGLVAGGTGFAATAGTSVPAWAQIAATVVPLLLPLITGWLARRRVTPTRSQT